MRRDGPTATPPTACARPARGGSQGRGTPPVSLEADAERDAGAAVDQAELQPPAPGPTAPGSTSACSVAVPGASGTSRAARVTACGWRPSRVSRSDAGTGVSSWSGSWTATAQPEPDARTDDRPRSGGP